MKTIFISTIFLFFYTSVVAEDATLSIDAQIEAIKKAPPQKRVEMMNALKQRLATMNQEQRMKAIQQMRQKMQNKSHTKLPRKYHDKMHKMAQEQQVHEHNQMSQMQNMSQKQAGDQYMHANEGMMNQKEINGNMMENWKQKDNMPNMHR